VGRIHYFWGKQEFNAYGNIKDRWLNIKAFETQGCTGGVFYISLIVKNKGRGALVLVFVRCLDWSRRSGKPGGNLLIFTLIKSSFQEDAQVRLSKVILFHKRSTYQLRAVEFRDSRFIELLEQEHMAVRLVKKSHSEHTATLERLSKELKDRKIKFHTQARSSLNRDIEDIDLLIAVGGDGTFLDASHYLDKVPVLGVNSALSTSFGHFCLANENSFGSIIEKIESETLSASNLMRLTVLLNGKPLPVLALNEILIAHKNPAATSRYIIADNNHTEEQLSSGVWIATAAGSTGSMNAAGGQVLPITSRQFQYYVREPCIRPGAKKQLQKGLLMEGDEIKFVSQMRQGTIFIDGQHIEYPFTIGDEVLVKASDSDLRAFVDPEINKRFVC
jgi:NAD+ kinase